MFYVSFYYQWDHTSEMCYSTQDCANINTVWASLIIEECSRLGLTVRLSIINLFSFSQRGPALKGFFVTKKRFSFFDIHASDLSFIVVFLCSSGIEIIPPCCCRFHSSPNNMHCMFWWALTCISCCWLCKRISQPSSSHNIIRHCSFKSSSCCESYWIFMIWTPSISCKWKFIDYDINWNLLFWFWWAYSCESVIVVQNFNHKVRVCNIFLLMTCFDHLSQSQFFLFYHYSTSAFIPRLCLSWNLDFSHTYVA